MSPQKPFDVTLDNMVDAEIEQWLEERDQQGTTVEPEPLDFDE
jgi:hypothetical protein